MGSMIDGLPVLHKGNIETNGTKQQCMQLVISKSNKEQPSDLCTNHGFKLKGGAWLPRESLHDSEKKQTAHRKTPGCNGT